MTRCKITYVVGLMILWSASAKAGSIVAEYTWEENAEDWTKDLGEDWYNVTWTKDSFEGSDGYLRISLESLGRPPDPDKWYALAYVNTPNIFSANWTADSWIEFDFWAEDREPTYVQVQMGDNDTETIWSTTVFDSDIDSMDVGTYIHLSTLRLEDWVDNLSAVDWIGVYIRRTTRFAQDYGLDNFQLMIPEPGQITMLAAAIVTSALSFRRKKKAAAAARC